MKHHDDVIDAAFYAMSQALPELKLYPKLLVFYDGALYAEYPSWKTLWDAGLPANIYNTAFISKGNTWWRADGTPYPTIQVPKEYLALKLIL